jgi:hypothetical protein
VKSDDDRGIGQEQTMQSRAEYDPAQDCFDRLFSRLEVHALAAPSTVSTIVWAGPWRCRVPAAGAAWDLGGW